MLTAKEYTQMAENLLNDGVKYDYAAGAKWNKRQTCMSIGRAQVYATLAQAAANAEQTAWWQRRDEEMGLGTSKERSLAVG